MPLLGLGSRLKSGLQVPSAQYFNLATWHTINFAYTKKAWSQICELQREAQEKDKLSRLQNLVTHDLAISAQFGRHLVEGIGELTELILRSDGHNLVEISLAEFLRHGR